MVYMIERFGWLPDPLDHRDCTIRDEKIQRTLARVAPLVSAGLRPEAATRAGALRADLKQWCSPIEDQGSIGSCTAHAVVGAFEYFERKARGQHVDGSRLFLYKVTRKFLGWDGRGDTGAFVRSAIKALRLFGTVPENYLPYDEQAWDAEPTAFHYAFAQNFRAVEYFRVEQSQEHLKSVLDSGLPFMFGFTCFSSLTSPEVAQSGMIPFPDRNESAIGGHAVLAVGYTDSHVLIRNSWGTGWGDQGYGYLPWRYFDGARPLADDAWVLVNAAWMPDDEGEGMPAARAAGAPVAATDQTPHAAKASRPTPAAKADARPRSPSLRADDALRPLIKVSRGNDPTKTVPLRMTAVGLEPATPQAVSSLAKSAGPVSLYLKSLTLKKSFDWALFGKAINELYVVAVAWDLSGQPPRVFPPSDLPVKGTYNVEAGETVFFVGDGLQLWPPQEVVGGLYVRILVMESDEDVRTIGAHLEGVRNAVQTSELTAALAALVAGATAGTVAAVAAVAMKLTGVIAEALQNNGDDLVALFDGTYGADSVLTSQVERYEQNGALIELGVRG